MISGDSGLPSTHRALVQEVYAEPFVVKTMPTPPPTPGAAVVKVLAARVMSYAREVYNGVRKYDYPTPLTGGSSAIGRIAALGPDATVLKVSDLVYVDCTIRGRDDPDAIMLLGLVAGSSAGSRKLIDDEWRNGSFAEYVKAPLETLFRLDEHRLCGDPADGGLGYQHGQLNGLLFGLVPFGGLRSVSLSPGETVIIAPATGGFSSAAVMVAVAMGARVIAMGRNTTALAKLQEAFGPDRVATVPLLGNDADAEKAALVKPFGPADVFLDLSPAAAAKSSHFAAAFAVLRHRGRVSLMGGIVDDLALPYGSIMRLSLSIKGKWMYDPEDVRLFIKMMESGVLDGRSIARVVGSFSLEEWSRAFDVAAENGRLGEVVNLVP